MKYHLEQISKKQQQLKIVKLGIAQIFTDRTKAMQGAVHASDYCSMTAEFDNAKKMAEELNAGLELIKDIESSIEYHNKQIEEAKAKKKEGKE